MVDHNEHGRLMRYHGFLLGGRERIEAYERAIAATVRPGDRVIDLGTGTGVFAMLALRAGAEEVVAIEDTPAIALALEFARANRLEDRLRLIPRSSRRVTLGERADVLVTDTYASLGLQDGLLGSVLDARDRLLASGGSLIPSALTVSLAALEAPERHAELLRPWADDLCGLDLSAGRSFAANAVQQAELSPAELLGPSAETLSIDLTAVRDVRVEGTAALAISRPGVVHGLAGWFSATLARGVEVSNAPGQSSTPYAQAWLPFADPVAVGEGSVVEVRLATHDGASWRWAGEAAGTRFEHATVRSFPLLTE